MCVHGGPAVHCRAGATNSLAKTCLFLLACSRRFVAEPSCFALGIMLLPLFSAPSCLYDQVFYVGKATGRRLKAAALPHSCLASRKQASEGGA